MERDNKIGIIGCGNMGEAIAKGIVYSKVVLAGELYLYDIDRNKSNYLKECLGVNASTSAEELINSCGTILLAVKPQDAEDLLRETWHLLDASKLVISILAGTPIKRMKKTLKEEQLASHAGLWSLPTTAQKAESECDANLRRGNTRDLDLLLDPRLHAQNATALRCPDRAEPLASHPLSAESTSCRPVHQFPATQLGGLIALTSPTPHLE